MIFAEVTLVQTMEKAQEVIYKEMVRHVLEIQSHASPLMVRGQSVIFRKAKNKENGLAELVRGC